MNSRDMLTGALIALSTTAGRATQQLTDETDDIVIGGVAACCGDAPNDAALNAFAERAHEENLRLAKESEGVANADFDMENLEEQDENVKALKRLILAGLRDVASPTLRARNKELSNPEVNAFFRAVLYTIGGQEAATGSLIELSTKVGEVNWYVCEALGQATNAVADPNANAAGVSEDDRGGIKPSSDNVLFTGVLSRPLGWLTTQVYNGIMNLAALPFSFA